MKVLISEYATFRRDVLEYIISRILPCHSVILDPMAGTAPLIPFVETHGYSAYFNDILPVHFFVNKAKQYSIFKCHEKHGYSWFLRELLNCMRFLKGKRSCLSENWIDDNILNGLLRAWHAAEEYDRNIETLLKAVIITCVRPFSSITRCSNPTWFKPGGVSSNEGLRDIVKASLIKFEKFYDYFYKVPNINKRGRCIFSMGSAVNFHPPSKVDLIVTSPSYCNRLDILIQFGPENYFLSALGYMTPAESVIATTKVRDYGTFQEDFGNITSESRTACHLLNKIKNSPKTDGPKYYLPYYTRYFTMLFKNFIKVLEHLLPDGRMYVVVQDNIHRGELIEIDKVLRELLKTKGWRSRVVKKWERHHLGLRNVSRDHAFVKKKHYEKLMVIWQ